MTDTYPIDSGIIRCVCGFDDDDGFTIQCEKCNAWQHAQCVDIGSESEVPEVYYCDKCSDRKVDIDRAIQLQMKRKEDDNLRAARKSRSVRSVKFRDKLDKESKLNGNGGSSRSDGASGSVGGSAPASGETTPILEPVSNGSSKSRKKRLTVPSKPTTPRYGSESDTDVEPSEISANNGLDLKLQNKLLERQIQESYLFHIVKAEENAFFVYEKEKVLNIFEQIPSLDLHADLCSFVTKQEFGHVQPVSVHVTCSNSVLLAGNKFKYQGFSRFNVLADSAIPRGRYIMEVIGHVTLQDNYKSNPINQYRLFGMPKPGVFFIPGLSLAVDGRRIGSEASFLRLNCSSPNAKISTLVVANHEIHFGLFSVKPVKSGEELSIPWTWDLKHPVQKVLAVIGDSDSWSDPKILRRLAEELSVEERTAISRTVAAIENRGIECACGDPSNCLLTLLKQVRNQQASAVNVAPTSPTSTIYSAREQRKLQGALSLIDKLSGDNKKKRKRDSLSPGSSKEQNHDDMIIDEEQVESGSSAQPTEPLSAPQLRIPSVQTFQQAIKAKFDDYQRNYFANAPTSPSPASESIEEEWDNHISPSESGADSPIYKKPTTPYTGKPFVVPRSASPKTKILPTVKEEVSALPSGPLKQKPPVLPSQSTGAIPSISSAVPSTTAVQSSAPKLVKKLSFADYIKKKNK